MPLSRITTNFKITALSLPLLVLVFAQEWQDYFTLWSTSYIYNHGFLVFVGTLYLIYRRRDQFDRLQLSFSWFYFTVLLSLILFFLIAHAGNIKLIRMILMPLMLIAWGTTLWGRPFIKVGGPPIILILFGAPLWDEMSPALQWLTVAVDERVLEALSIPATINEFYITIPSGTFFVDNGCSGIRYLMVALYLGAFHSCLTNSGLRRAVLTILFAGLLALLSNWIRVAWIIAAGHYTNMESSLVEDHELFGWVIFLVVTLIPFLIFSLYLERNNENNISRAEPPKKLPNNPVQSRKSFFLANLPLLAIPVLLFLQNQMAEGNAQDWKTTLPASKTESSWTGPILHAGFWKPNYEGADIELSGVYVNEKREQVQLNFYGYADQSQGKELIYYTNKVYDDSIWQPIGKDTIKINTHNLETPKLVNQLLLRSKTDPEETAIVWYWFEIADSLLTSETEVQLVGGWNNMLGDKRAAIWIMSSKCNGSDLTECKTTGRKRVKSIFNGLAPW